MTKEKNNKKGKMCCKSISWIELYASKIIHIKLFVLVYLIVIIVLFSKDLCENTSVSRTTVQ